MGDWKDKYWKIEKALLLMLVGVFLLSFLIPACAKPEIKVREPAASGKFYPGDPAKLDETIHELYKRVPEVEIAGKVRAIISPHAGYQFSGQAAACGYSLLEEGDFSRVIILGPSHYVGFHGCSLPEVTHYRTPLGLVEIDSVVREQLLEKGLFSTHPQAHELEHSIEVQLPFLQAKLNKFKLVPIVVGDLSKEDYAKIAESLKPFITDDTLIVASSDFTHYGPNYGYVPFAENIKENLKNLDMGAVDRIIRLDFEGFLDYCEKTQITICGQNPISILLNLLPADSEGKLLMYYTSGDILGEHTNSVSYCSIVFTHYSLTKEEEKTLLSLARKALENFSKEGKLLEVDSAKQGYSSNLMAKRGAFVTLTEGGKLRGCMGYIVPHKPLYQTIIENAVNAAFHDQRFKPLKKEELKEIEIEISVLSPLRDIEDISEIGIGKHGLLIIKGEYQGLLLPQVAVEYDWDRITFLEETCIKAGLPSDAWQEGAQLFTFTAKVFREE